MTFLEQNDCTLFLPVSRMSVTGFNMLMLLILVIFFFRMSSRRSRPDRYHRYRSLQCCPSEETARVSGNGVADPEQDGKPGVVFPSFHSADHPVIAVNVRVCSRAPGKG